MMMVYVLLKVYTKKKTRLNRKKRIRWWLGKLRKLKAKERLGGME